MYNEKKTKCARCKGFIEDYSEVGVGEYRSLVKNPKHLCQDCQSELLYISEEISTALTLHYLKEPYTYDYGFIEDEVFQTVVTRLDELRIYLINHKHKDEDEDDNML